VNADDKRFIDEALPAFISEAREQVAAFEQLLLRLEDAPDDRELLDALFRCAHTVKGSAGIFGLDEVVAFTHHVETLLDRMREGALTLDPALSTLLLQCNDQTLVLVDQAGRAPDPSDDDAIALATARRAELVEALRAASGAGASAVAVLGGARVEDVREERSSVLHPRHIRARFGADTFRNGMDPLAVLHYVSKLGRIDALKADLDAVPPLDEIDPESCHLGVEFEVSTSATLQDIEAAFSFVRDDCELHIGEPASHTATLSARIDGMPDQPRIGEILVAAGAVSHTDLEDALAIQARQSAECGAALPLGEILATQAGLSKQVVAAALDKQTSSRKREATPADDGRYIRVQADRLDAVINLLGELVIAGAGAELLARQSRNGSLIEANTQIGRLIEEIRNGTLQLRMVPIGETFSRFRRVVRDTASELGKDVALQIVGADTELDKAVVERIADPLMHLVRNALDHGLETPAERVAAGKPAQGTLTLSACHETGSIVIRIVDDGHGIRRQKVLERAWERGLVERGVVPPDDRIVDLIFEPGFSTAAQVTNLSGRGVGMDVVRRNIEALRGSVTVHSDEGEGSTIEIRLPLTLAIIDGFLVGMGSSRYIFPLETVVEVIESRPTDTERDARGRSIVELRGHALPVVSLRELYALPGPAPARSSVVVIQSIHQRYGVLVDSLLGQHQTVIKPLGRMFRKLRGFSGSSILGNGEVALIFDAASLGQLASAPVGRSPLSSTETSMSCPNPVPP
jgi:two-component system chemotaxis sensor kinase CheA